MENDLLYQISLTLVPYIGSVHAKNLVEHFKTAENIFKASKKRTGRNRKNIGEAKAAYIKAFSAFAQAEKRNCFS